jgi:hypothetical protein
MHEREESPMSDDSPSTVDHREYDRVVRSRLRVANTAAWLRASGIQVVWLIILIAGAGVPLTQALDTDGWTWVNPTLGFIVVIAAGVERIFSRTTPAAVSLDVLRRDLARERRLLMTRSDAYESADDPHRLYAERVEGHIALYDEKMVDYNMNLLGRQR